MLRSFGKISETISTYISIFEKDYKSCTRFIVSANAQGNTVAVALITLKATSKMWALQTLCSHTCRVSFSHAWSRKAQGQGCEQWCFPAAAQAPSCTACTTREPGEQQGEWAFRTCQCLATLQCSNTANEILSKHDLMSWLELDGEHRNIAIWI